MESKPSLQLAVEPILHHCRVDSAHASSICLQCGACCLGLECNREDGLATRVSHVEGQCAEVRRSDAGGRGTADGHIKKNDAVPVLIHAHLCYMTEYSATRQRGHGLSQQEK